MTDWKTSEELKQAFPDVDINMRPVGDLICCQVKMPREKVGNVFLTDDTKELHRWETMVAKVVKEGPVAFRDADTLKVWPEGRWAEIGDYVIIPKYGSVRFTVNVPGRTTKCIFAFLRCKDIRTVIEGNPLEVDEYA